MLNEKNKHDVNFPICRRHTGRLNIKVGKWAVFVKCIIGSKVLVLKYLAVSILVDFRLFLCIFLLHFNYCPQSSLRPVGHGAAVQWPWNHCHPGGRSGDNWHHNPGPHFLHLWGDPVGSPVCSHSDRGGGGLLGGLLQVWKHDEGTSDNKLWPAYCLTQGS